MQDTWAHCRELPHGPPEEEPYILCPQQHGFRRMRSCETQLLEFMEKLSESTEKGLQTDIVILDFTKAFDKVNHNLLLHKLHHIVMESPAISADGLGFFSGIRLRDGLLSWMTQVQECCRDRSWDHHYSWSTLTTSQINSPHWHYFLPMALLFTGWSRPTMTKNSYNMTSNDWNNGSKTGTWSSTQETLPVICKRKPHEKAY